MMNWLLGTGGFLSTVLSSYLVSRIRSEGAFQKWMLGAWASLIKPIDGLAAKTTKLWTGGLDSLKQIPTAPFRGESPTSASFVSPLWIRVATALIYLMCFLVLLVAELRLGKFRMNALFGLGTNQAADTSVDQAAALVLVASGVVWATFALEVFDLDLFGLNRDREERRGGRSASAADRVEDENASRSRSGSESAADSTRPVRRAAQGVAVLGLVCSASLACVSFYVGQDRADELARQAFELEQRELDRSIAQTQNQARFLCELLDGEDCEPAVRQDLGSTQEAVRAEFKASGRAVRVSQVLLAFSLFGALAIAGAGLVPTVAFVARVAYLLVQSLIAPLVLAAFIVDASLRLLMGSLHLVAGAGSALFAGYATIGEMSAKGAKAVKSGLDSVGDVINLSERRRVNGPGGSQDVMPEGPETVARDAAVQGFAEAASVFHSDGSSSRTRA